jgi:hypothetical protein
MKLSFFLWAGLMADRAMDEEVDAMDLLAPERSIGNILK